MESNKTNGIVSDLKNIFCSTRDNYYYSQVAPSQSLIDLSKAQSNCVVMINTSSRRDTIYAPDFNNVSDYLVGDLRFFTVYSNNKISQSSNKYSDMYQNIRKFSTDHVWLYRKTQVYLRYAEAMNRAGFPETAFTVLKYGLYNATIQRYISRRERDEAGTLLDFEQRIFTVDNTQGIHSRGSGVASANLNYNFPEQATLADSILFVENLIADECALECGFEGMRYFDLMRFSMHRDDNTYIAEKVANRNGKDETDYAIFTLLTDRKNWFLPLK